MDFFTGIKVRREFGQNFLVDKNVLRKIIEAADLKSDDVVLEVGAGTGILTQELAKRVKKVVAIELDKNFVQLLKENLKGCDNVEVIQGDVLRYEHPKGWKSRGSNSRDFQARARDFQALACLSNKYKIVANLPYNITSKFLRKFLSEEKNKPSEMILMLQKEVAQRICAVPPQMSLLSVSVQFYSEPKILFYVSKNSFWPKPNVDSALVRLTLKCHSEPFASLEGKLREESRGSPLGRPANSTGRRLRSSREISRFARDDISCHFFEVVKAGFKAKRKQLKNNLGIDERILAEIGLNPKARAQDLSVEDWIKLAQRIKK